MIRVRYHGSMTHRHGEGFLTKDLVNKDRYAIMLDSEHILINVNRSSFTILGVDDAGDEVPDTNENGQV